jgi:plasmid stabilization system protein ParE
VARTIEWAGRARSNLRLAVEYIRKDSPNGAKAFVNEVFRTTRSLETMPERGRRYRVLYEVHPDAV